MSKQAFTKCTSLLAASLLSIGTLVACSGSTTTQSNGATDTANAEGSEVCAPEITAIDFGILSTESQDNLRPKVEPFVDAIEAAIGRPVNAFYATDYAAVIEGMGAGKVQLAWLGGKSYIEAAKRSDAEAFARVINADGTKGYYAYLIVNKDNPILSKIDVQKGNGDQYVIQHASELDLSENLQPKLCLA